MKNRIELAEYFASKGFKEGAEVGVADGRYSEILCEKISGLKLLCVDPFYRPGHYERTVERLSKYGCDIERKTSMEAVLDVADGSLDFVFIDGNHSFDFVMEDLIGWGRKVRKGGVLSGHDYYFSRLGTVQVIPAVNKYCEIHRLQLHLTEWDYTGHQDDRCPCWYIER